MPQYLLSNVIIHPMIKIQMDSFINFFFKSQRLSYNAIWTCFGQKSVLKTNLQCNILNIIISIAPQSLLLRNFAKLNITQRKLKKNEHQQSFYLLNEIAKAYSRSLGLRKIPRLYFHQLYARIR